MPEEILDRLVAVPVEVKKRDEPAVVELKNKPVKVEEKLLDVISQRAMEWAERFSNRADGDRSGVSGESLKEKKARSARVKEAGTASGLLAIVAGLPEEELSTEQGVYLAYAAMESIKYKKTGGHEDIDNIQTELLSALLKDPREASLLTRYIKGLKPGGRVHGFFERRAAGREAKMLTAQERSIRDQLQMIEENPTAFLERRLKERKEKKVEEAKPEAAPASSSSPEASPPETKTGDVDQRRIDELEGQIAGARDRQEIVKILSTIETEDPGLANQVKERVIKAIGNKAAEDPNFSFGEFPHKIRDEAAREKIRVLKSSSKETKSAIEAETAESLLEEIIKKMKGTTEEDRSFRENLWKLMRDEDQVRKKDSVGKFLGESSISVGAILLSLLIQMFSVVASESGGRR